MRANSPSPKYATHNSPSPRPSPGGRGNAKQILHVTANIGREFVRPLRRDLRLALRLISNAPSEVSIALVNDATMSALHERHLNIPGPTDVLTFELDHDSRGRCVAGEVAICVPEARRRAKETGTTVQNELILYGLHGLLHLAGFDDRTGRAYRAMHRMEDHILTQIGVGPVFEPGKSGSKLAKAASRSKKMEKSPARRRNRGQRTRAGAR
jgi:rRNA maturation RNase YbeY